MIEEIKRKYEKNYQKEGRNGKAIFWPKDRNQERFGSLYRILINYQNITLLDFGCGLGDLKTYLDDKNIKYIYMGVDIVQSMINDNCKISGTDNFRLINNYQDINSNYDFIAIFGVFNLFCSPFREDHQSNIYKTLTYLFSKTNTAILVNFMHDTVDFIQENAYHQNINDLLIWVTKNFSSRYILDTSYLPFEFSLTVFKNQQKSNPADYLNPLV